VHFAPCAVLDEDDSVVSSEQGLIRQNPANELLTRKVETISLSDISRESGPTTMSFGYDPTHLQHSVMNVGMVNPPLVREEIDGKATVIAGFRRIHAARSLGWQSAPCRIVSRSEVGDLEGLMINLYDNLTVRTLNEIEKGMVLSRLAAHLGTEEILNRFMPLLGMASHYPLYRVYLEMEKALTVEEKEYVAQGSVSFTALKAAIGVEATSRIALLSMLHNLRLNINQQIQFIDYMVDLSNSNQENIVQMLQEPPLENLCRQISANRPQKGRAILNHLRSRRFPALNHAEQGFKASVSGLNLPKGVRIEPPPYFEGPEIKMEIRFTDGRDLRNKVDELARIETLETIGPPWKVGSR
jgi:ParB family chromosome partitioning protein